MQFDPAGTRGHLCGCLSRPLVDSQLPYGGALKAILSLEGRGGRIISLVWTISTPIHRVLSP